MKKALIVLAMNLAVIPAFADDSATGMTPSQARTQWESMSPEQQAVTKSYMKSQAQAKQENWNALSPDEQQAKKEAARSKAQPYAAQGQAQVQERMSGMNGGMPMVNRPFGHRAR